MFIITLYERVDFIQISTSQKMTLQIDQTLIKEKENIMVQPNLYQID